MPNVWNPFGEFARMRDEMRHMFGETPFLPALSQTPPRADGPSVDVHETETRVVVTAEIPGVEPTDLNVTVDELQITISGETKRSSERDEDGYRLKERRIGRFSRTVPLPAEVKPDEAWADYKHGVLEVRMNKAEQGRIRSRRLQINAKH